MAEGSTGEGAPAEGDSLLARSRAKGRKYAGVGALRGDVTGGERLGGFIYGVIVALSVVIAGARAYPRDAWHAAILVAVTSTVFWLAHVYAHALGESVARGERLGAAELRHVARHELSIVEAAVLPTAALLLGAVGIVSAHTAYWLAFALGLCVLVAEGLRFARVARLGPLGALAVVAANVSFGLVLVGLKLFVSH